MDRMKRPPESSSAAFVRARLCAFRTNNRGYCDILLYMEKLEKRINALRAELESLYLRVKAGEPRMEDVLKACGELDRLLLERSGSGGAARGGSQP
jgi:hypothetical protein